MIIIMRIYLLGELLINCYKAKKSRWIFSCLEEEEEEEKKMSSSRKRREGREKRRRRRKRRK